MASLTAKEIKMLYSTPDTRELTREFQSLQENLGGLVSLKTNPSQIYAEENVELVKNFVLEGLRGELAATICGQDYDETVYMEGLTEDDDEESTPMEGVDAHIHNIEQLIENSLVSQRAASANLRNMNEILPLDAFIPLCITRSYLPLVGKDIMPYVVTKMPFIRFKELRKWIVTKDGNTYIRPNVYNDIDAVEDIINSGKGRSVSDRWYPIGEEVTVTGGTSGGTGDTTSTTGGTTYVEIVDGKEKTFKIPTGALRLDPPVDLLEESGGNRNIGDALSQDVYIEGARGIVTTTDGKSHVVETLGIKAYYDVTSYTPQRSISFDVTYVVHGEKGDDGTVAPDEKFTDRIHGTYDAEAATFELVSARGFTKQIMFGGNLSNKNNIEYISFKNDFKTFQHTIPEGIRSNVPITYEDTELYKTTANIDIVANAVVEMNEIFTNLEDTSVVKTVQRCYEAFEGKDDHNFYWFQGKKVCWTKEVDLKHDATKFFKRFEYIQDELQYALTNEICEIRTVCENEPFKIHLLAHPNIASKLVGDKFDWKISAGASIADNIRADYNAGVYTADGNSMRLIAHQKFKENWGIIILVQPVNEENFMTWKHFKKSVFFDKNHKILEMPNNPNIMGVATFHTHAYVPFQVRLIPKNYK